MGTEQDCEGRDGSETDGTKGGIRTDYVRARENGRPRLYPRAADNGRADRFPGRGRRFLGRDPERLPRFGKGGYPPGFGVRCMVNPRGDRPGLRRAMRFLLDMNLPPAMPDFLRSEG